MFNMAQNPNPTSAAWKNSGYLSTLWAASAITGAPFTYSTVAPNNSAITVNWTNTTDATEAKYTSNLAIDAGGNIWSTYNYYSATTPTYMVTQYSPAGARLQSVAVANIPSTYSINWYATGSSNSATTVSVATQSGLQLNTIPVSGIAVDTNNNVWFNSLYTGLTKTPANNYLQSTSSFYGGLMVEVTQAGTSTGYLTGYKPAGLAFDASNNMFVSSSPASSSTSYTMGLFANASGAVGTTNFYTGYGALTANTTLFVDGIGRGWESPVGMGTAEYNTCLAASNYTVQRGNAATVMAATTTTNGNSGTQGNLSFTGFCPIFGAPADNNGGVFLSGLSAGTSTSDTVTVAHVSSSDSVVLYTDPAGAVTYSGSAYTVPSGALFSGPGGVAVDGSGNAWIGTSAQATNKAGGVVEMSFNSTSSTFSLLSPAGQYGYGDFFTGSGTLQYQLVQTVGVSIDSSGNVWSSNANGTGFNHIVGVAAPVVTPLSVALKNGAIATKP